jgi:hypothetical protein
MIMYARLNYVVEKLDQEITNRELADSNEPLSDQAVMTFTLLTSAVIIAARGADQFTDEEMAAFERKADKLIKHYS